MRKLKYGAFIVLFCAVNALGYLGVWLDENYPGSTPPNIDIIGNILWCVILVAIIILIVLISKKILRWRKSEDYLKWKII